MKTQREAVFEAVCDMLSLDKTNFCADSPVILTSEQRRCVIDAVSKGISDGVVQFSCSAKQKHDTPQKIRTYAGSLVSNWLRKDDRLCGNSERKPQSPPKITNSTSHIKNLKNLLWNVQNVYGYVDSELQDQAEKDILTEIRLCEKYANKIDIKVIPDHLKHLIGAHHV